MVESQRLLKEKLICRVRSPFIYINNDRNNNFTIIISKLLQRGLVNFWEWITFVIDAGSRRNWLMNTSILYKPYECKPVKGKSVQKERFLLVSKIIFWERKKVLTPWRPLHYRNLPYCITQEGFKWKRHNTWMMRKRRLVCWKPARRLLDVRIRRTEAHCHNQGRFSKKQSLEFKSFVGQDRHFTYNVSQNHNWTPEIARTEWKVGSPSIGFRLVENSCGVFRVQFLKLWSRTDRLEPHRRHRRHGSIFTTSRRGAGGRMASAIMRYSLKLKR